MKRILSALLATILASCPGPGVNPSWPAETADTLALYRQDVMDVAYLASPETEAKLRELNTMLLQVEDRLRRADISGASDAIDAAILLADEIVQALAPDSDLRFYLALTKIALRHARQGQTVESPAQ